jgi:hypothetical protein
LEAEARVIGAWEMRETVRGASDAGKVIFDADSTARIGLQPAILMFKRRRLVI